MFKRAILTVILCLLTSPLYATGSIYTSAKTAIAALKGCTPETIGGITFPCELLGKYSIRVMLVNGYTYNAAHDFVNDVQSFEVADIEGPNFGPFYVSGWPSWSRIKLTGRTTTSSVFDANDVMFPWLNSVTFDGIILHYWDRECGPSVQTCRTGGSHPLIAYFPVSPAKTITNQPLMIVWSEAAGKIINYSDASSANWTATDPGVYGVTFNNVFIRDTTAGSPANDWSNLINDTTGQALATTSGSCPHAGPCVFNRYTPTNPGNVILKNASTPGVSFAMFDGGAPNGMRTDGFRHTAFPTSLGGWKPANTSNFQIYRWIEGAADIRPDRGDEFLGCQHWSGATLAFLTNYECTNNVGEQDSVDGGQLQGPTGGGFSLVSTTTKSIAVIGGYFHGTRSYGSNSGVSIFFLDTLWAHHHEGPSYAHEYAVMFRSAIFDGPNHNNSSSSPASKDATLHEQDSIFIDGQDFGIADSFINAGGGADEIFLWHNVAGNSPNAQSIDTLGSTWRLDMTRKQLVVIDNILVQPGDTVSIGKMSDSLFSSGLITLDHNLHYCYTTGGICPPSSGIFHPYQRTNGGYFNIAPLSTQAVHIPFTNTVSKMAFSFVPFRNIPVSSNLQIAPGFRRQNAPEGNITLTIETDSGGVPSGAVVGTRVWPASGTGSPTTNTSLVFSGLVITTQLNVGQTYHVVATVDATYIAGYDTSNRLFWAPATQPGANQGLMKSFNGVTWDTVSGNHYNWIKIDYQYIAETKAEFIASVESKYPSQYPTGSIAANDKYGLNPQFTNIPGYTVPLPNPGNLANQWGFRKATSNDLVRSWYQINVGSPAENAASDGNNIGLSDADQPTNSAPSVSAGNDQTIGSGEIASIVCTASDDNPPPTGLVYTWSQVSGASGSFGNTSSASTTFNPPAAGTFVLRCSVSDGSLSGTDDVTIVEVVPPVNVPPTVDAGTGGTIPFGATFNLDATVSDPDSVETVLWTKDSGPGTATFGSDTSVDTTVTFTLAGTYVLKLTATDIVTTVSDTVTVIMQSLVNQAPTNVNAGSNQTIDSTGSATIGCTAQDDGLPDATLTFAWTETSGPGTPSFGSTSSANTTVSFDMAGTYILRCTVSDSEPLSANDEVQIIVTTTGANATPVITASSLPDLTIYYPIVEEARPLVTDDGLNTGLVYRWRPTAGPNTTVTNTWTASGGIPEIKNVQGSDIGLTTAYLFPLHAGLTEKAIWDLRSATDPTNTHILAFKSSTATATFSFIGQASTPTYGFGLSQAGATVAVTPVAGIAANDLVVMVGTYRASNVTITMSELDSQTWACGTNTQNSGNALTSRVCWAFYSGASAASPSMTVTTGTDAMTVQMLVFRPSAGTPELDVAETAATPTAADPQIIAGISPTVKRGVVIAAIATQDDNRFTLMPVGGVTFGSASDDSGGGADGLNNSIVFPEPGTYVIEFAVYDGEFTATDSHTVVVLPQPVKKRKHF